MNQPENEINPVIKKKLDLLKSVQDRPADRVDAGRSKFLAEARSVAKTVSPSAVMRRKGWFEKFTIRKERYAMVKILTIILIAVSTALAGTGVVAAASQSSLPDQALYDVKLWTEDLRMGLVSSSPEDTLDLALNFADRRVTEISKLTDQGVISPDSVRTRLEIEIYQAYQAVTQLQGDLLSQALLRMEAVLHTQEETMLRLNTNSQTEPECTRTRDMIQQHLRMFEENHGDVNALQTQIHLRLQLHKPAGSGNPQGSGQNSPQTQGTPQSGAVTGNGGNSNCLTGTPEGGYGNGNMYLLTGTPEGGYGNGNMYSLTGTPTGGYGIGNQYCLTATPAPGTGKGTGGKP